MKNIRAAIVLHMLYEILDKGFFSEPSVMEALNISRSTFFRALSDYRCYLLEHRPWEEIEFNSVKQEYRLVKIGKAN